MVRRDGGCPSKNYELEKKKARRKGKGEGRQPIEKTSDTIPRAKKQGGRESSSESGEQGSPNLAVKPVPSLVARRRTEERKEKIPQLINSFSFHRAQQNGRKNNKSGKKSRRNQKDGRRKERE